MTLDQMIAALQDMKKYTTGDAYVVVPSRSHTEAPWELAGDPLISRGSTEGERQYTYYQSDSGEELVCIGHF